MMKAAHAGKSDNLRTARGSRLERPPLRCISQPVVNSFCVVVGDVFAKPPMQMLLVEYDYMVEEFAATSADPSFGNPVLLWASIGGSHGLRAKAANCLSDRFAEDRIAVVDEIGGGGGLGECFAELLDNPLRRGVRCDVEVHHLSTSVGEDKPHVQHSEANC